MYLFFCPSIKLHYSSISLSISPYPCKSFYFSTVFTCLHYSNFFLNILPTSFYFLTLFYLYFYFSIRLEIHLFPYLHTFSFSPLFTFLSLSLYIYIYVLYVLKCFPGDCPSGQQLDETSDVCTDCGLGFFRDASLTWTCQSCPQDLTTTGTRSTSASDCSVCEWSLDILNKSSSILNKINVAIKN